MNYGTILKVFNVFSGGMCDPNDLHMAKGFLLEKVLRKSS